ncbi:MoaD/ThiS family protein [Streptomyces nodosus]|uniref:MoaD/ThiS family protein n=1 Tax=Streptomyces nodosus TaxID=40318 RepID=A0A0B5DLJ0_9ACTN|nr:MoaD/ThiS family protein [Streptomyces nodosus]AJE40887.1 thiamine biosynthesis protein ThiS [Streptomyces nodosus]MBB4791974.1 molybdopterin converting factor small subunit [Streptomyces nodosus]QEV39431.1 MoaD/ThiS family protein [Streptomyces nodosus]
MAIEVRIPTILRQYTGGQKAVEGTGETLAELITDLETRHAGIQDRIVDGGELRRFVNVYLNDEDVRFLDGISTKVADGDSVTILPAVAGGSAAVRPVPAGATAGQRSVPADGR